MIHLFSGMMNKIMLCYNGDLFIFLLYFFFSWRGSWQACKKELSTEMLFLLLITEMDYIKRDVLSGTSGPKEKCFPLHHWHTIWHAALESPPRCRTASQECFQTQCVTWASPGTWGPWSWTIHGYTFPESSSGPAINMNLFHDFVISLTCEYIAYTCSKHEILDQTVINNEIGPSP